MGSSAPARRRLRWSTWPSGRPRHCARPSGPCSVAPGRTASRGARAAPPAGGAFTYGSGPADRSCKRLQQRGEPGEIYSRLTLRMTYQRQGSGRSAHAVLHLMAHGPGLLRDEFADATGHLLPLPVLERRPGTISRTMGAACGDGNQALVTQDEAQAVGNEVPSPSTHILLARMHWDEPSRPGPTGTPEHSPAGWSRLR
jgi:hypothetical protein